MTIGPLAVFCIGSVVAALYLWVVRGRLRVANTALTSTITELRAGNLALTSTVTELKEMDAKSRLEADYKAKKKELTQDFKTKREDLEKQYQDALAIHTRLSKELSDMEEHLEDMSFGVYEPHFRFDTSAEYKAAIEALQVTQRECIRQGKAAHCPVRWEVEGSKVKGDQLAKRTIKMMLRAFNGEADAATAKVTWNNISKMEERLRKSYSAINTLGESTRITITEEYLQNRLDELRLTHEYEEKKYQEKEAQRAAREAQREELKAAQEIEKAQEDAEQQETTYETLLAKARAEAEGATGMLLRELMEKVATFEAKLDEARKKKERAISRAQLTKSGFVYVISNVGAFGEKVFKIGMTRRMEPFERVAELSGAAVPFPFDLHAMLYSDNAPELECALHRHFDGRRLNLVNPRKEFYRDVELEEIKTFVTERGLSAQFTDTPEARQWRETVSRREVKIAPASVTLASQTAFPGRLFA
jgi:hypothetical protein